MQRWPMRSADVAVFGISFHRELSSAVHPGFANLQARAPAAPSFISARVAAKSLSSAVARWARMPGKRKGPHAIGPRTLRSQPNGKMCRAGAVPSPRASGPAGCSCLPKDGRGGARRDPGGGRQRAGLDSSARCRSCSTCRTRRRSGRFTPATVYAFDDAAGFLRSDPEIALHVARLLAQRLNAATTYLVDLKRQYAGNGNHLGMVSDVLASLIHQQEREFTPGSDRLPDPAM